MGTTATGLRYPESTDPANAGALNFKNLADDVTTKYPTMQSGSQSVALTTGAGTATVTFPKAFAASPAVSAMSTAITSSVVVAVSLTVLSATSFTVKLRQLDGGTYSGNVNLYWIALRIGA
jgi:hypothetical protein